VGNEKPGHCPGFLFWGGIGAGFDQPTNGRLYPVWALVSIIAALRAASRPTVGSVPVRYAVGTT
jgi:hypothetical protein